MTAYLSQPCWDCLRCGVDTWEAGEYYMVLDPVWAEAVHPRNQDKMLCIGCLEARLRRRLRPEDFFPCPLNTIPGWGYVSMRPSLRLLSRLAGCLTKKERELAKELRRSLEAP